MGSPLSASMPNTAPNAAKRIVVSKVGTVKAGTLLKGFPRGLDEVVRILELGHQPVDPAHPSSSLASNLASGRITRISKIEIIGSSRTKRKSSVRNSPNEPRSVPQSHFVP